MPAGRGGSRTRADGGDRDDRTDLDAATDGRIRLVHCIGSMAVGGAERQLADLIARLPPDRFDQRLVLFSREGPLLDQVEAAGCEIVGLRPPGSRRRLPRPLRLGAPRAFRRYVSYLRAVRPHVVHAQLDLANVLSVAAGRTAGVPAIATSELSIGRELGESTVRRTLTGRADRSADRVFVNSQAVMDDVVERTGIDVGRLQLVHNGVDLDRFRPIDASERGPARAVEGLADDDVAVVYVANEHPYKGHADLIRAIAQLAAHDPNRRMTLMLVGREHPERPARRLAAELGIADRVHFAGERHDVERLLPLADLVVHASHTEGFSNAVLEAMACGRAVVAYDVGGNREAIVDGATGVLVPARDVGALATAIGSVADDPDRLAELGRAARERVAGHFSVERMVDRFAAAYEELAGRTRSPLSMPSAPHA